MYKQLFFVFILFSFLNVFSQAGKSFEINKKLYLKGNSVVVGNTIIGEHPINAFNDLNISNDQVKMQFIDIDDDAATFSSSSARITEDKNGSQIVYAGLYWSGLYPFKSAVIRPSGNRLVHKEKGIRDSVVNSIKLLLPDSTTYLNIEGAIIYDSFLSLGFDNNKPYVCYADVTQDLKKLSTIQGDYTVANVRATEGYISGGSAAGWVLYVVYKDEAELPRYFTTYDGLVEVNRKSVEIPFADFKTKEKGEIESNIVLATLEGDTKIRTDDCAIFSDSKQKYLSLENELRAPKNFFNSSITSFDEEMLDRNPASKNTLGFDLLKFKLPEGSVINNTVSSKLRFYAKADRFYLFFTAFETEISEDFLTEKNAAIPIKNEVVETKTIEETPQVIETVVDTEALSEEETSEMLIKTPDVEAVAEKVETNQPISMTTNIEVEEDELQRIFNRPSIPAKGMIKGYYIVTNVFENRDNAIRWKEKMNSEGHNGRTFTNTDTGYMYVYIESDVDPVVMMERKNILEQLPYLEGLWIARVNLK